MKYFFCGFFMADFEGDRDCLELGEDGHDPDVVVVDPGAGVAEKSQGVALACQFLN